MSQKRTVTCFRSPSNAEREVLGGVSLRGGELCRGHGGGRDFERFGRPGCKNDSLVRWREHRTGR